MSQEDFTRPARLRDPDELLFQNTIGEMATRYRKHPDDRAFWDHINMLGFSDLFQSVDGQSEGAATFASILAEEAARVLCSVPVVSGVLLSRMLLRSSGLSEVELDSLLGTDPVALLVSDDLQSLQIRDDEGLAWDAGIATRAIALRGPNVSLVELGDPTAGTDLTRFARRPIGAVRSVGTSIDPTQLQRIEDLARLLTAADSLGAAEDLLQGAVEYAKDRIQFGVAIGSFQAVQHICAQAFVELEGMRSAITYGSWAWSAKSPDSQHAIRVAKAYANTAALSIVNAATQVFGGVAILWEHAAHRTHRRVLQNRVLFGDERSILVQLGLGG